MEKDIKLIFTAKRINSIDISITITFFLFKKFLKYPERKLLLQELSSDRVQFQSFMFTPSLNLTSLRAIDVSFSLEI